MMSVSKIHVLVLSAISASLFIGCTPRVNEWQTEAPKTQTERQDKVDTTKQEPTQIEGTVVGDSEATSADGSTACSTLTYGSQLEILEASAANCFMEIQKQALETKSPRDGLVKIEKDRNTEIVNANATVSYASPGVVKDVKIQSLSPDGSATEFVSEVASGLIRVGENQILIKKDLEDVSAQDLLAELDKETLILIPGKITGNAKESHQIIEVRVAKNSVVAGLLTDSESYSLQTVKELTNVTGIIAVRLINALGEFSKVEGNSLEDELNKLNTTDVESTMKITHLIFPNMFGEWEEGQALESGNFSVLGAVTLNIDLKGNEQGTLAMSPMTMKTRLHYGPLVYSNNLLADTVKILDENNQSSELGFLKGVLVENGEIKILIDSSQDDEVAPNYLLSVTK